MLLELIMLDARLITDMRNNEELNKEKVFHYFFMLLADKFIFNSCRGQTFVTESALTGTDAMRAVRGWPSPIRSQASSFLYKQWIKKPCVSTQGFHLFDRSILHSLYAPFR
jgi:hypothetical protein